MTESLDLSSGLEPTPGVYQFRYAKNAPILPVRIRYDGEYWHVLVAGKPAHNSGQKDPMAIPILLHRWPLHPITDERYEFLLAQHAAAHKAYIANGIWSPLLDPKAAVNLRGSSAL